MGLKESVVIVNDVQYRRHMIRTHFVQAGEDWAEIIRQYASELLQEGMIITISESAVASSQGRAIPVSEIKPSILARMLWRFVRKVPYGIGLRSPYSMEMAIRECGAIRVLIAAIIGGPLRLLGIRGVFYRIAGKQAAMIDAAGTSPLYPDKVVLGPKEPDRVAECISRALNGLPVAIVDVNDVGGSWVVGASSNITPMLRRTIEAVLKDNPAGQGDQLTPIVIIEPLSKRD
ncbi:MAG: coenzyme F420-0:L-glutamate ligase [Armatimonadota bacterium]|nr:coenzyme F420-0:L-glutamate ligase [Armatimonadota bacterium]MCX7777939.1 coenzyme F420-0:L-glutamate ligase [Armatimonadota bacterium]MDW8025628.1 coenzyme F420-0:L-glutamate ligase [Armatimonadota bacterium]